MRRLLTIAFAVGSMALFASPVGNPAFPKLISQGYFIPCDFPVDFRSGYEGDFVSDARMKQQSQGRVDCYEQSTNSGTVTLNILNRVDIYGVLGSSRTEAQWRFTNPLDEVELLNLETGYDFLWGIGARGILYEGENVTFGVGGRYSWSDYNPNLLVINGLSNSVTGSFLHWSEWQVDMDLSYRIDLLTPYVGVKYSNTEVNLGGFSEEIASNGSGSNQFNNRTPVGIFIGCSISTGKYFMLNVEGRLIDEEAVTISGDIRF